jgi:hypothetical protein
MNVIEDGLTYFECISRSIGKCTGIQVHDTILYYFMKIVFSNAAYTNFQDFCENIKSNNTKHLKLNPQLVNNNAVKQWVKRFSHVEKSVATTPDVWFISYPKLLKGAMLRFFYWHRDYSNKPHRIYCKYVFSYLIADFYNCSVGIAEEGGENAYGVRWFYPLGAKDYYQSERIKCIVIRKDTKKDSFSLLEPPELIKNQGSIPPLLLSIDKSFEEEEEMYPRFVLRVSKDMKLSSGQKSRSNDEIAKFVDLEGKEQIYICDYNKSYENTDIYQIYPGNPNHCFFDIGLGECMIMYCVTSNGNPILCAVHKSNEQYPYFQLIKDTKQIVVVIAKDISASKEMIRLYLDKNK